MKEITIDDLFKDPIQLYIVPWLIENLPKMIGTILLTIAFAMLMALAGSKIAHARSKFISTAEVAKRIQDKANMLLIDVRSEQEFIAGHISGAINIPLHELEERLDNLGDKKETFLNTPIVIHCRTQNRAKVAHAIFIRKGFMKLEIMKGGFSQWGKERRTATTGTE
ncbi:MAG: rhodanese-like domain-containing protein [Alphaproteobacteria bacterium]|nr:rhodanese-like domain-containing protein [Alphaproteobacteria bacterium]